MPLKVKVAGKTDKGLVRTGNEDYLYLDDKNNVYAVCDGMGGHQAGEVASMMAADTLDIAYNHYNGQLLDDPRMSLGKPLPASGELLLKSIRLANRGIHNTAQKDSAKAGMGTTIVAMAFEADFISLAHVGDSRAYRLEDRKLVPLTKDHSWVEELQDSQKLTREEASTFVGKNVITRALGVRETVEVDYRMLKIEVGDIFIMCSDGLCGFADDEEIYNVAAKHRDDISRMADDLVQMANDRGGADNVTVIIIEVEETLKSPLPDLDVFTLPAEDEELLMVEDEWLEKLEAFRTSPDEKKNQNVVKNGEKGSKLGIFLIFLVFIIVAGLFVYFTQK